jgi:hypothetical protein
MPRPVPLLMLLLLASCERPGERVEDRELAARALEGVLAYPRSAVVSIAAGPEAAQAAFTTPAAVEHVAAWYRETLRLNGWELKSDRRMAGGSIVLYAERGGRPLWITLQGNVGGPGTSYTLVGRHLAADSATDQRSGSSMSSNRIQRR